MAITFARYNNNFNAVAIGGVTLYFSYATLVGIYAPNQREAYIAVNVWGPTTGRHLNSTGLKELKYCREVSHTTLPVVAETILSKELTRPQGLMEAAE